MCRIFVIKKCRLFAKMNEGRMKRKTLKNRMLLRIRKSKKVAFISSDFFDLSDGDQVGRALRSLVKERLLIKLGRGIFAKTNPSLLGNKTILAKDFPSVAREALDKLKIRTYPTKAELDYNSGISTQIPTGLMVAVNKRVARTISYNGRSIKYERAV